MAIALDKTRDFPLYGKTDRPMETKNRSTTTIPFGNLTPSYMGEIVEYINSGGTATTLFRAIGLTNQDWVTVQETIAV